METPAIDDLLPRFDHASKYTARVAADPGRVGDAAGSVRIADLPVGRTLMAVRSAGKRREGMDKPLLEAMKLNGFTELWSDDRQVVLGAIGRFWRPRPDFEPLRDAEDFRAFTRPGFAKAVMDFRWHGRGSETELVTETRVQLTDARARRIFALYWVPVRIGGGVMRHEMLRAVKRRAESG